MGQHRMIGIVTRVGAESHPVIHTSLYTALVRSDYITSEQFLVRLPFVAFFGEF